MRVYPFGNPTLSEQKEQQFIHQGLSQPAPAFASTLRRGGLEYPASDSIALSHRYRGGVIPQQGRLMGTSLLACHCFVNEPPYYW